MSVSSRSRALAVASALTLAATGFGAATAAHAAPATKPLSGSVPTWATSSAKKAAAKSTDQVTFRVYLDYSDPAGAEAYAKAVSTKGDPLYGKYLTPAQFRAKFAPSQASVDAVRAWLKGAGFTVGDVPDNRKYVEATGTVAQASTAFGTSFAEYQVQGQTVRGNSTPLQVPASLTGVQDVIGLDEGQALVKSYASAGFRNAQPCSAYWGEKTVQNTPTPDGTKLPEVPSAFAPCGYTGAQLQGAYGITPILAGGNTGQGVTVGIIDAFASPTIESDANTYFTKHGLPTFAPGQFSQTVPNGITNKKPNKKQDPDGWAGEETLDVEAVHTMAPGANIRYIGSATNGRDMDALMNRVVDQHMADIVSNSYGYAGESLHPGTIKPSVDTQIQAAAEGMTLMYSSGDDGDETAGDPANFPQATPDWPASSPYVTAVGGTSLGVSADNSRVFELGWETAKSTLTNGAWSPAVYQYGSGGGTSRLFAQPSYQAGVVPDTLALGATSGGRAQKMRVVPDVSALGDPNTGILVGQTQTFSDGTYYDEYRIGGTSLACPLYAGMMALVVKAAGHDYGLANPALYATRATSYDITKAQLPQYPGDVRADYVNGENASGGYSYTARWFDSDQFLTIHVRDGYDDVTGIGSPNGAAWFTAMVNYGK